MISAISRIAKAAGSAVKAARPAATALKAARAPVVQAARAVRGVTKLGSRVRSNYVQQYRNAHMYPGQSRPTVQTVRDSPSVSLRGAGGSNLYTRVAGRLRKRKTPTPSSRSARRKNRHKVIEEQEAKKKAEAEAKSQAALEEKVPPLSARSVQRAVDRRLDTEEKVDYGAAKNLTKKDITNLADEVLKEGADPRRAKKYIKAWREGKSPGEQAHADDLLAKLNARQTKLDTTRRNLEDEFKNVMDRPEGQRAVSSQDPNPPAYRTPSRLPQTIPEVRGRSTPVEHHYANPAMRPTSTPSSLKRKSPTEVPRSQRKTPESRRETSEQRHQRHERERESLYQDWQEINKLRHGYYTPGKTPPSLRNRDLMKEALIKEKRYIEKRDEYMKRNSWTRDSAFDSSSESRASKSYSGPISPPRFQPVAKEPARYAEVPKLPQEPAAQARAWKDMGSKAQSLYRAAKDKVREMGPGYRQARAEILKRALNRDVSAGGSPHAQALWNRGWSAMTKVEKLITVGFVTGLVVNAAWFIANAVKSKENNTTEQKEIDVPSEITDPTQRLLYQQGNIDFAALEQLLEEEFKKYLEQEQKPNLDIPSAYFAPPYFPVEKKPKNSKKKKRKRNVYT